jgi:hypothetical protein
MKGIQVYSKRMSKSSSKGDNHKGAKIGQGHFNVIHLMYHGSIKAQIYMM